jgi:hypothetical protein
MPIADKRSASIENTEIRRLEPGLRRGCVEQIGHGGDRLHRLAPVHFLQHAAHGACHTLHIRSRADCESHVAQKERSPHLLIGLIDGRMRMLRQARLVDVIDYADNRQPILRLGVFFQSDALS